MFELAIRKQRSCLADCNCIDIDSTRLKPTLSRGLDRETNVAPHINEARSADAAFDPADTPPGTTYLRIELLTVLPGFIVLAVKLSQLGRGRHRIDVG